MSVARKVGQPISVLILSAGARRRIIRHMLDRNSGLPVTFPEAHAGFGWVTALTSVAIRELVAGNSV